MRQMGEEKKKEGERRIKTRWAFRGLTWTQRGFKGVLDVAEARKARQLGGTAGCQNLCPLPLSFPNQTTTSLRPHFLLLFYYFFGELLAIKRNVITSPREQYIFDELNHDAINDNLILFPITLLHSGIRQNGTEIFKNVTKFGYFYKIFNFFMLYNCYESQF